MWDEITYPFSNFNSYTNEVWEWICNFIPHFTGHVITYSCWDTDLKVDMPYSNRYEYTSIYQDSLLIMNDGDEWWKTS